MTDHRSNIYEYRDLLEANLRESLDSEDPEELEDHMEEMLEVRILREADNSIGHVDFLLTFGDPNTWLHWDSRWGATLFYSWGRDAEGNDCTEIPADADLWGQLVEHFDY